MVFFIFIFHILASNQAHAQEVPPTEPIEIHCNLKSESIDALAIHCNENKPGHFSVVVQTGEFAGFASTGMSFRFLGRNQFTLLGGYFPEKINGSRLWEANLKYEFHPFKDVKMNLKNGESLRFNPFYFGAGIIYGIHKNLFVKQPPQYPPHYYLPTAIAYTFNVGTSVSYHRVTVYVEYSALDLGVISMVDNARFYKNDFDLLGLAEIGTLGFGLKYNLQGKRRP